MPHRSRKAPASGAAWSVSNNKVMTSGGTRRQRTSPYAPARLLNDLIRGIFHRGQKHRVHRGHRGASCHSGGGSFRLWLTKKASDQGFGQSYDPYGPYAFGIVTPCTPAIHGNGIAVVKQHAGESFESELAALVHIEDVWCTIVFQSLLHGFDTERGLHGDRQTPVKEGGRNKDLLISTCRACVHQRRGASHLRLASCLDLLQRPAMPCSRRAATIQLG